MLATANMLPVVVGAGPWRLGGACDVWARRSAKAPLGLRLDQRIVLVVVRTRPWHGSLPRVSASGRRRVLRACCSTEVREIVCPWARLVSTAAPGALAPC